MVLINLPGDLVEKFKLRNYWLTNNKERVC